VAAELKSAIAGCLKANHATVFFLLVRPDRNSPNNQLVLLMGLKFREQERTCFVEQTEGSG
jgi:hypothetical protein